MKFAWSAVCSLCLLVVACAPEAGRVVTTASTFPELRGPYMGQKTPGLEPELFAPGLVSTGLRTRDVAMTPDGTELYFTVMFSGRAAILVTRQIDGVWTEPVVAPFSGRDSDGEPAISPDGRRFFFLSSRPGPDREPKPGWGYQDIWVMDREGDGWGEPHMVGPPISTEAAEFYPSVTRDGTLYFTRQAPDGVHWILRSRLVDGHYTEPERLGPEVNCGTNRFNAYVAPDESFVIVPAVGREDSLGGADYYIVFRSKDDTWSQPVNMGPKINSATGREWSTSLSPDGKFLFFMSSRTTSEAEPVLTGRPLADLVKLSTEPGHGSAGIWWVDAGIIEQLRP